MVPRMGCRPHQFNYVSDRRTSRYDSIFDAISTKLLAGESPTDQDLSALGLKRVARFDYISPVVQKFERRDNKVSAKNQNAFKKEYSKNINRKAHMGNLWGSEADEVSAKKGLGQHFLNDLSVADAIGDILPDNLDAVLEIGPGMGVLTKRLFPRYQDKLLCVELDLIS